MSRDALIGREGALPWRLPRDLRHFRQLTWGKPILMGRKTFESLGRPLPGRANIVLTRRPDYHAAGCRVAHDREQALRLAEEAGAEEAMVIGGGQVYRDFLPLATTIHLTLIEGHFPGDVFFPEQVLDSPDWVTVHQEPWTADDQNPHEAVFLTLRRLETVRRGPEE
jgi:dihydrofolate reductase